MMAECRRSMGGRCHSSCCEVQIRNLFALDKLTVVTSILAQSGVESWIGSHAEKDF